MYVHIICIYIYYICDVYILYEYTGKQRPTFSSVRKVTLNGCYGINTNDNNNGAYPPPLPSYIYIYIYRCVYTCIYGHCITSTPIIGSHCYLYCFYCSPSRFHPLLSLFYCIYISYIIYEPYNIIYTIIISSPCVRIYSRSYARKPISTTGRMSTSGLLLLYRHRRLTKTRVYSPHFGVGIYCNHVRRSPPRCGRTFN